MYMFNYILTFLTVDFKEKHKTALNCELPTKILQINNIFKISI